MAVDRKKKPGRERDRDREAPPPSPDGRVLPNDLEMEKDVLSACFRSAIAVLKVRPLLTPEHLFDATHKIVFEAMLSVAAENKPVDMSTVRSKLRAMGMLDRVGGAKGLADLTANRPEVPNLIAYAEHLLGLYKLRELIGFGHRMAAFGHDASDRIQEFAEEELRDLGKIVYGGRQDAGQLQHVRESLQTSLTAVETRNENDSPIGGVATGYRRLDEMTCGIMDGDVWFIAARPGMGKTSALLGICARVTAPYEPEQDQPPELPIDVPEYGAAFFTLEMPRDQITGRLICMDARVGFERWRSGRLRGEDWGPAYAAADRLGKSRLWVDDTPNISLEEAEAKLVALKSEWDREPTFAGCPVCTRQLLYHPEIRRWHCLSCHPDPRVAGALVFEQRTQLTRERRIAVAGFDYFGLMRGDPNARSREEEMGGISRGCKTMAKRRKVGVIVAAQLNRAVEKRAAKERLPELSDLRETGSVEQDADMVMFLYRAAYYRPDDEKVRGRAQWIIAKQRNGPPGTINMLYEDSCSRFDDEHDMPRSRFADGGPLPAGL